MRRHSVMKLCMGWSLCVAVSLYSVVAYGAKDVGRALACAEETHDDIIPQKPNYADTTMWITIDGDTAKNGADVFYVVSTWEIDWLTAEGRVCHYADVWNSNHRDHMAIEMRKAGAYMSRGNRFYAPYYRHTTIDAWVTLNEDTIHQRTRLAMADVCEAFDYFQAHRDQSRPFIIVGFSQGGMGVVELLKHIKEIDARCGYTGNASIYSKLVAAYVLGYKVIRADMEQCDYIRVAEGETDTGVTICYNTVKDVKYVQPVISGSEACINPVNWCTDATPATLHDTITVTLSPEHHVLVVKGYEGSEYPPYRGVINVGDIHSCEPWLYSDCLQRNFAVRTQEWRNRVREERK